MFALNDIWDEGSCDVGTKERCQQIREEQQKLTQRYTEQGLDKIDAGTKAWELMLSRAIKEE